MSFLTDAQKSLVNRLASVADDVEARMMLGNVGVYAGGLQIGILDDGALYLRAQEEHKETFAAKGATPYNSSTGVAQAAYFRIPDEIFDDEDTLKAWVAYAVEAAADG